MGSFNKWIRGEKSFSAQEQADHLLNQSTSASLSLNLKHLSKLFSGIPELITRTFPLKNGKEAALIYMEGLVDKTVINMNIDKDRKKLTSLITKQLNKDLNDLIHKIQKQQLDPFGFGDYARAFQYKEWKEVEDDWPSAFSKANVKVVPTIKILENGIIK
ncbi:Ger(x)C family spore germination C-terminal domain-containing protein [Bacillus sp. F9_6S_D1_P_5]